MKEYKKEIPIRFNLQIKADKIRLIGSDGKQIGIVSLKEGLEKAHEEDLDLIEIAPTAEPPVCKIYSIDKYKYEEQKKRRDSKKKQKEVEIKEFRFRPNIFKSDFDQRVKRIKEFIQKGYRIKVTIQYRGREITHKEIGQQKIDQLVSALGESAVVDQEPKFRGKNLILFLSPNLKEKNT